ncbi:hypothetical protein EG856_01220 [Mycoplasmopsis phocirhinis]|uniref:IgA-specific metalloendopeptidase n=1 Tax=Mycoplasmopsis phocirhinis TaxID=142650 RepID=A0A4P6MPA1_9BACT|nr:ZmpA/ZmpB/ZmpC family metallo-endopeptidase [Mycoplasmopsis phocirhinis]QBF34546.1 hypothetical protein EG856_01220 [Mycoplasmopsis phocirhinis]
MKAKRKKIAIIAGSVGVVSSITIGLGLGLGLNSYKDNKIELFIEGLVDKNGKTGLLNTYKGKEIELNLITPVGKKLSKLLVDGVEKTNEVVNNTYSFVQSNIKQIKAEYSDLIFEVKNTNNLKLVNKDIDLSTLKYGQNIEFEIMNPQNLTIDSLLINSKESKNLIKNNRISINVKENLEINLTFVNTKEENFEPNESNENLQNGSSDLSEQKNNIDNVVEEESNVKLIGFENKNIVTKIGKEVVAQLIVPKNSSLQSLLVDGVEKKDSVINNTFTFTTTKPNHKLIAVYQENKYVLSLDQYLSAANNIELNNISFGQNITINIDVPEGKEIQTLNVNGSNKKRFVKNNSYQFIMRNNTQISVQFKDKLQPKQNYSINLGSNLYMNEFIDKNNFKHGEQATIFIDIPQNKSVKNVQLNGQNIDVDTSKGIFKYLITQNSNFSVEFNDINEENNVYVSGDNNFKAADGNDSFKTTQKDNFLVFKIDIPQGQEIESVFGNDQPIPAENIVIDGNYISVKINNDLYYALKAKFKEKIVILPDKKTLQKTVIVAKQKHNSVTFTNEPNQILKDEFVNVLNQAESILDNQDATQEQIDLVLENLEQKMNKLSGIYTTKSLEFKNTTSRQILLVNNDGSTKQVSSINANNVDPNNYLVRITDDETQYLIPVKSIEKMGDQYKLTLKHNNLVLFNSQNDVIENYSFYVDEISDKANVYSDFNTLINAIKLNPNATFLIGSDLYANSIEQDQYIDIDFRGVLKSVDGKNYAIHNLNKPLFKNVINSTVSNFKILNSRVVVDKDAGILAKSIQNSVISNLFIDANLVFKQNSIDSISVGGLSLILTDTTVKNNVLKINLDISSTDKNGQYFGLLAAKANNINSTDKKIEKNYISGVISNTLQTNFTNTKLGKIIGNINNLSVENNIIDVMADNIELFGQKTRSDISNNKIISGQNSNTSITITKAKELLRAWGIDIELNSNNNFDKVDYSTLAEYDSMRQIAYENVAKLLPNYDRNTITKYANLISTSDLLFKKKIYSLLPMHGNEFVSNLYDKNSINRLFVKFEDGSATTYDLASPVEFEQSARFEYRLGADLIYSPNQYLNLNQNLVDEIVAELSVLSLDSTDFVQQVKLSEYNNQMKQKFVNFSNETIKTLYLDSSFKEIKLHLDEIVKSLLANYQNSDYNNEQVARVIKKTILDNKVKIMLGLTYINRLFKINFGQYNILKIMLFNPNFYNNLIKNIDFLIEIGSLNFEELLIKNNFATFNKYFKKLINKNLFEFLEYNLKVFTNSSDMDEWFKTSTKAFISEQKLLSQPQINISAYQHLKTKSNANGYILPLLNLQESNVYIISTLGTIFFGSYGRNIDEQLLVANKNEYQNEINKLKQLIIDKSIQYRKFMELMYKISNQEGKDYLTKTTTEIFDGYFIVSSLNGVAQPRFNGQKRRWAERFDEHYSAINDFFGPINRWYPQSVRKDSAYANQNTKVIRFDSVDILDTEGIATLTHELTHAYDTKTWLQGNQYRPGVGPEAFATGLFESLTSNNSPNYGFNFALNLNGAVTSNNNIDRFNSKEDFKQYLSGLFDVTYLLDAIEAEVILSKSIQNQTFFFNRLALHKDDNSMKNEYELYKNEDIAKGYTHGSDRVIQLDANSIASLNLQSVYDLIDHNIVSKLETYGLKPGTSDYLRNNNENYYSINLFRPIFAAYSNNTGATGGLIFRRNALELLAEFGWDAGFVNYATDVLSTQLSSNQLLSEDFVLNKIFDSRYANYNEFKKAMFKKRLDKKDQIKSITIRFNNQNYIINNSQDLKNLFNIAIDKDIQSLSLNNRNSFVSYELKRSIIQAYNSLTKNFQESIFK